jgi:hypothetical protein
MKMVSRDGDYDYDYDGDDHHNNNDGDMICGARRALLHLPMALENSHLTAQLQGKQLTTVHKN